MELLVISFVLLFIASALAAAGGPVSPLPKHTFSPFDSPDFCTQNITTTCNTTFSYIDDVNSKVHPLLSQLVQTSYFKYFKLNFEKQCKFWNAQHFCATENCAVEILPPEQYNWTTVTNSDLKPSKLGEINRTSTNADSLETETVETCEDLDYTHIDDDHQCVYVNLLNNPERFTGYGGSQSFDVWKAIYSENCFPNTNPMSMVSGEQEEQCVEKNLFYRLISGLHASIAVHLSNDYLNADTGEFYPNLRVFMERVGSFNDRLSNIYFNYALVSQALVKLTEVLPLSNFIRSGYDDITPAQQQHHHLVDNDEFERDDTLLQEIMPLLSSNTLFNTSTLFNPKTVSPHLKDEFRARFKNVSAIMDCVGCDRCRMWGKLQTIGYGTALKILFESEDPKSAEYLKFRRIEVVALVNTFHRLSKSIDAINNFKGMYLKHLEDVSKGIAKPGEYESDKEFAFPFYVPEAAKAAKAPAQTKRTMPTKKVAAPAAKQAKKHQPASDADRTFAEDFQIAFNDVWAALKFVLLSYRNFPKYMWRIGVDNVVELWNGFIQNPRTYEPVEKVNIVL